MTLVVNAATASPVLITALTTAERHREREKEGGWGAEGRGERAEGRGEREEGRGERALALIAHRL